MIGSLITITGFLTAGLGWRAWLLPVTLSVVLVIAWIFNYLLFHTLAEIFPVAIAIVLMLVVWNTYSYTKNHFLMYLGIGYFCLAIIDSAHTISFKGMGVLPIDGANISVQLWLTARFLQSLLLLSAPLFLSKEIQREKVFLAFASLSIVAIALVFSGNFPVAFIEEVGLTEFKINTEYTIIAVLGAAIIFLRRMRSLIDFKIYNLMVLTIVATMISELAFTFYVNILDLSILVGHIFKLFSFWFVYQAIIITTLRDPFAVMARGASTYNAIPDPAVVINSDGLILQSNRAACEQSGLDEKELVDQHFCRLFGIKKKGLSHDKGICGQIRDGIELKKSEIRIPETGKWYRYSLTPIEVNSSNGAMVLVTSDITTQKNAQKSVLENERLLRTLLDTIPDLIWLKDKEGKYIACNSNFEKLYDVTEEELIGKTDYDYAAKEQAKLFVDDDRRSIEFKKTITFEEWVTFASDGHKALLETTKTPMTDGDDNLLGVLGIARDITERYEGNREREQLQKDLQQSQKMESLGKLTGGIAHDFNNILGVIMGYSGLLKNSLQDSPELEKFANQVELAGKRGSKLTNKLLGFSREKASNQSVAYINDLLNEERHLLEKSLTSKINLDFDLADDLSPVLMDGYDFEDTILNICINAMHAMPGGGELRIESRNIEFSDGDYNISKLVKGKYVVVSFSDTGSGMDKETKERLFEPFFSTKGDKGTGLGMSQVFGFMKRSRGRIDVDSVIGEGTTINLYFPVYTGKLPPAANVEIENNPEIIRLDKMVSESILVVDDEGSLRELAREILSLRGYKVVCAKDGESALSILEKEDFDLMISDVIMPKMNGYQLAMIVREKYPETKIQMVSGFSGFDDDREYIDDTDDLYKQLLRKPVSINQLLNRVSIILSNNNLSTNGIEEAASSLSNLQESKIATIVEWHDDLLVGIDAIDSDHKKCLELLNKSRPDEDGNSLSSGVMLQNLEELTSYAKYHFEREERIMEVCNYPSLSKHRRVHQYLLREISNKVNSFKKGLLTQEELYQFFSDWLNNHIMGMDKKITPYTYGKEELISTVIND